MAKTIWNSCYRC